MCRRSGDTSDATLVEAGKGTQMAMLVRGGLVLRDADAPAARADILIEGERIVAVEPVLSVGPDTTVLDARERLVIPGLVNAHTHAHNHLAKGAIDGLPLELWLGHLAARVVGRTPHEIYVGAALGAIEMARTGTTCACEMAQILPWPTPEALDAVAQAYADVGLRASIAAQVTDLSVLHSLAGLAARVPVAVQAEIARQPPYPLAEVLATLRDAAARWHGAAGGRLRFGVGPSIVHLCSDAFLRGLAALATERGLDVQTHLCETKAEAVTAWRRYGRSATAQLRALGLLGPRTLLAHSIWLDDADIAAIAEAGSTIAHNPISNLKLGAGVAPLLRLRERGCQVALGTDGSASSDNQNLFGALRLSALLPRVTTPDYARWPSAADAFRMATLGGARAAGFEGHIGRIAPGYAADLVLLDLHATYFHPLNDPIAQLVYCEVGSSVRTVLVAGRVIVEEGRVTTVDEAALLAEADAIATRIQASLDGPLALTRHLGPYLDAAYRELSAAPWPAAN